MLIFACDMNVDGTPVKAGDKVPSDIRPGVLAPLKRLGRVAEFESEPESKPESEPESEPESKPTIEKPKRGRPRKTITEGD